jgi:hypothetical protein
MGNRLFRSSWYSSTEVDSRPPRNRDLGYNSRSAKAVRYYAWKTENSGTNQVLYEWAKTWQEAAMSTKKGKPKGIVPASLRFPDEAINGDEPTWYKANMFWDYFEWGHVGGTMILDQMLFSYTQTFRPELLGPLIQTLKLIEKNKNQLGGELLPGSEKWAVDRLINSRFFWSLVSQWRMLTNNNQFDGLLLEHGTPYVKYRITKDQRFLNELLQQALESVSYNFPMLTSEVMHTDRVYVRGYENVKAMLTGDGIVENMSPYYAATWEDTDETFTALVEEASMDYLKVQAYSHGKSDNSIILRVWMLQNGPYNMTFITDNETVEKEVTIQKKGQRISINLPEKELLTIRLMKK